MKQPWLGLLLMAISISVLALSEGHRALRRGQQVRTQADLQTITAKIESVEASHRADLAAIIEAAIDEVNDGRDLWGNPFLYDIRDVNRSLSYLVFSTGSDGELDVGDTAAYFFAARETVTGKPTRDIVFRDGLALKNGGK